MPFSPELSAYVQEIWYGREPKLTLGELSDAEIHELSEAGIHQLAKAGIHRHKIDFIANTVTFYHSDNLETLSLGDHISDLYPGTVRWDGARINKAIVGSVEAFLDGEPDVRGYWRRLVKAGVVEFTTYCDRRITYQGPWGESYTYHW